MAKKLELTFTIALNVLSMCMRSADRSMYRWLIRKSEAKKMVVSHQGSVLTSLCGAGISGYRHCLV